MHFCKTKCDAKMHFCTASNAFVTFCFLQSKKHSIFAQLNIFQRKMYAEHFPLENVRQNAFWHQIHFCITFCFAEHFPLENVMLNILLRKMYALPKCILASNAFLHQMHFCTASLFFAKQKTQHFCTAEHFPLENVRKNAFLHQMHFCIKCIFASNAFCRFLTFWFAKMHFCTNKM